MAGFKTAKAKKIWNELPVGSRITASELRSKLPDSTEVKEGGMYMRSVSSYLSRRIFKEEAVHDGKVGRWGVYKKLSDDTGQTKVRKEPAEFNELQLGRSILAIIEDQKAKLKTEKETIKDMVHRIKELEELYRAAQQKILALNQTDRPKSFKLHDIQNMMDKK